jgi:hypothetical protein
VEGYGVLSCVIGGMSDSTRGGVVKVMAGGADSGRAAFPPTHNDAMPMQRPSPPTDLMPDIPRFGRLSHGLQHADFAAVPADWELLLTDIQGSGQAIDQGRYKMVNALGAACIVAACNAAGRDDPPYVFGGDGASLLAPPNLAPRIEQALLSLQAHARQALGLTMRVGRVPVSDLDDGRYAN